MDERIIEILKKHNFSITNTEDDGEKYFTEIVFRIGVIENTFLFYFALKIFNIFLKAIILFLRIYLKKKKAL